MRRLCLLSNTASNKGPTMWSGTIGLHGSILPSLLALGNEKIGKALRAPFFLFKLSAVFRDEPPDSHELRLKLPSIVSERETKKTRQKNFGERTGLSRLGGPPSPQEPCGGNQAPKYTLRKHPASFGPEEPRRHTLGKISRKLSRSKLAPNEWSGYSQGEGNKRRDKSRAKRPRAPFRQRARHSQTRTQSPKMNNADVLAACHRFKG